MRYANQRHECIQMHIFHGIGNNKGSIERKLELIQTLPLDYFSLANVIPFQPNLHKHKSMHASPKRIFCCLWQLSGTILRYHAVSIFINERNMLFVYIYIGFQLIRNTKKDAEEEEKEVLPFYIYAARTRMPDTKYVLQGCALWSVFALLAPNLITL